MHWKQNCSNGGVLNALAGTVNITATLGDLTLQSGGTISATGYDERSQKPVMPGNHVSYTALPGGSVTLSAPNESVITEAGSLVDVSGSRAVKTWLLNGSGVPKAQTLASSGTLAGLGYPLLLSASNKTFLGTLLGLELHERREATLAAHALGATLGCRVLRAHDVRGACRVRDMISAILEAR